MSDHLPGCSDISLVFMYVRLKLDILSDQKRFLITIPVCINVERRQSSLRSMELHFLHGLFAQVLCKCFHHDYLVRYTW